MPNDLPSMGAAVIDVQQHRRSESLSDSSASSSCHPSLLTNSKNGADAQIRTEQNKRKNGAWSHSRRSSSASDQVRRSRFDIRHDNMLFHLINKRRRQSAPSTRPHSSNEADSSALFNKFDHHKGLYPDRHGYISTETIKDRTTPDGNTSSSSSPSRRLINEDDIPSSFQQRRFQRPDKTTTTYMGPSIPFSEVVDPTVTQSNSSPSLPSELNQLVQSNTKHESITRSKQQEEPPPPQQHSTEHYDGRFVDLQAPAEAFSLKQDSVASALYVNSDEKSITKLNTDYDCLHAAKGDSSAPSPGHKVSDADAVAAKMIGSSSSSSLNAAVVAKAGEVESVYDSMVTIGTRVEVYWDGEEEYFAGTLTKKSSKHNRGDCFFIEYDDGDREWIHLDREIYRLEDKQKSGANATFPGSSSLSPRQKGISDRAARKSKSRRNSAVRRTSLSPERMGRGKSTIKKENMRPSSIVLGTKSKDLKSAPNETDRVKSTSCNERASAGIISRDQLNSESSGSNSNLTRGFGFMNSATPSVHPSGKAVETTLRTDSNPSQPHPDETISFCGTSNKAEENWVLAGLPKRLPDDSSDSETDEEELMNWAATMFGITPRPIATRKSSYRSDNCSPSVNIRKGPALGHFRCDLHDDVYVPISEAVKLGRRRRSGSLSGSSMNASSLQKRVRENTDEEAEELVSKRRKEEAKSLTQAEIKAILAHDLCPEAASAHWVRRSMRQPSRSALDSPQVKALLEKLRSNDTDMIVLKMKKYVNDPNAPQIVLNAVLDALEENSNCEALYIQNFNEGMRDEQVLRLLEILKRPACKIWCLNIGETYKVKTKTWKKFADGLADTRITHMYASEHTITPELKDQIRSTIRDNRSKHSLHCDPDNLDTIVQCTHCWWNPFNTKSLRPYLKTKGFEYILNDKDLQGLRGSNNGAELA